MRKNSVRKFIHAILDLLPLFVIPIFAIYSMNHEISGNSINTSGYEVRNKYETNEPDETYSNLVDGNIYKFDNDDRLYQYVGDENPYIIYFYYVDSQFHTIYEGTNEDINLWLNTNNGNIEISNDDDYPYIKVDTDYIYLVGIWTDYANGLDNYGVTINESDYIPKEYVYNDGIVLDDEDIMSQFVYVTYNAVDKYFNMGNVFNMNGVYDWFVLNIFGGNAPISMFIVWNVVLYEFVMDLLMLLYGLFMWFIDMIEKLMSKPLDSIK